MALALDDPLGLLTVTVSGVRFGNPPVSGSLGNHRLMILFNPRDLCQGSSFNGFFIYPRHEFLCPFCGWKLATWGYRGWLLYLLTSLPAWLEHKHVIASESDKCDDNETKCGNMLNAIRKVPVKRRFGVVRVAFLAPG